MKQEYKTIVSYNRMFVVAIYATQMVLYFGWEPGIKSPEETIHTGFLFLMLLLCFQKVPVYR